MCVCVCPLPSSQEVTFSMLDSKEWGPLKCVEQLLSNIIVPSLKKMSQGWGELASTQGQGAKQEFMGLLENFVTVLAGAQESLQEKVGPRHCSRMSLVLFDLTTIKYQMKNHP